MACGQPAAKINKGAPGKHVMSHDLHPTFTGTTKVAAPNYH
jgi:hypothetical protein